MSIQAIRRRPSAEAFMLRPVDSSISRFRAPSVESEASSSTDVDGDAMDEDLYERYYVRNAINNEFQSPYYPKTLIIDDRIPSRHLAHDPLSSDVSTTAAGSPASAATDLYDRADESPSSFSYAPLAPSESHQPLSSDEGGPSASAIAANGKRAAKGKEKSSRHKNTAKERIIGRARTSQSLEDASSRKIWTDTHRHAVVNVMADLGIFTPMVDGEKINLIFAELKKIPRMNKTLKGLCTWMRQPANMRFMTEELIVLQVKHVATVAA
ncbi:hypothetical protein FRB93_002996 [Tulasnella sp. JGI-2019a]|nr:hypothetical protein FRB93_002996 [Tulasnella sp. JGI-2019a]